MLWVYSRLPTTRYAQVMYGLNETTLNLHGELIVGPIENSSLFSAETVKARTGTIAMRQILESVVPIMQDSLDQFREAMAERLK